MAGYLGVMQLLREMVRFMLGEAAMAIENLPDDHWVEIKQLDDSTVTVMLRGPKGPVLGEVGIKKPEASDGPCGGSWIVVSSHARGGWGPLLYDVAIEYATENGSGLTPDRDSVSRSAYRVWDYYMNRRPDVRSHQLDDMKGSLALPKGDDCRQVSPGAHVSNSRDDMGKMENELTADDLRASPISKYYTKAPTMINALKRAGKLRITA